MFLELNHCRKHILFWINKNIVIWPHVSAETNIETAAKQVAEAIKLIHSGKNARKQN